jgi:hypothetical protein
MSPFVYPIRREIDVPEAPVLVDVHLEHLTEVVVVELRQVLEQRPLLTGGRLERQAYWLQVAALSHGRKTEE